MANKAEALVPYATGAERVSSLDMETEREIVLFTACRYPKTSSHKWPRAIACNDDADLPFEAILDRVLLFSGVHTDYFLEEPPACRRCQAPVTENVKCDRGVVGRRRSAQAVRHAWRRS